MAKPNYSFQKRQKELAKKKKKEQKRLNKLAKTVEEGQAPVADTDETPGDTIVEGEEITDTPENSAN